MPYAFACPIITVAVAELSQGLRVGPLTTKVDLPTDDNAAFYGFLD
jgi:hypothetical protein